MATTKKTSNLGQPVNSTGKSSGNTKEKDISFSDPAKEAWLRTLYSTGSYEQADSAAYSTNHTSGAPLAPVESTSSRLYQNMQNGSVERRADGRYYVTSPTTQATATRTPTAAESYADRLLSTQAQNTAVNVPGYEGNFKGALSAIGENTAAGLSQFASGALNELGFSAANMAANNENNPLTYWKQRLQDIKGKYDERIENISKKLADSLLAADAANDGSSKERKLDAIATALKDAAVLSAGTTVQIPAQPWALSRGVNELTEKITGTDDVEYNQQAILDKTAQITDPLDAVREYVGARTQATDSGVVRTLGSAASTIANMVPSIGAAYLTGAPELGTLTMSAAAAGNETKDAYNNGASLRDATDYGYAKGLIEWGTEHMFGGIEALGGGLLSKGLKDKLGDFAYTTAGRIIRKTFNTLGENIEEGVSDWLAPSAERAILGSDAEDVSFLQAMTGQLPWKEEGLVTLLTTFALNGLNGAVVNSQKLSNKEAAELLEVARKTGDQKLIAAADALQGKVTGEEGKSKLSVKKASELDEYIRYKLKNNETAAQTYVDAVTKEAEAAETEIKAEAEKAAARRKAGLGEGSSYSINKGDATISVLNSDEAGNDIDGETTDFRITGMARENGRNVVRFVNENGETESVAVEDAGEAIGGDAGRFIRRLNAELGEYAPGAYELYEDGQDVDDYITLMDRAINLYAKNGADVRNITQGVIAETLTPSQLLFAQSAGNRLNTAERAEANRTAAELKQAVASAREASDVVALSRTRRQIEGYIKSLKQTRQQLTTALTGLETGTDEYNSISARIRALDAKIASNESLLEGVKEDIADAQKREHKGKKGSVSLNGGSVGTSQLAPVKSELSNKQKAAVEMAEALADVLPIRFTFFEGDAKDTQGLFIETGEIFVNINSGMAINKVLAASTISHELTHFIRQNSPADYIELRDYLVGKFVEQNGQEKFDGLISGRVREVMSEGVNADEAYDRAVEEFVCNACEDMLMDSKAVQRLAYENMSLFEKVKKWVEQTIAKIKAAYEDLDTFRAEAVFGRTLDGLQEIWDNALVNATRNFNATTGRTRAQVNENAAPESDVKFQKSGEELEEMDNEVIVSKGPSALDSHRSLSSVLANNLPKLVDMKPLTRLRGTELNDRSKKPLEQIKKFFEEIGGEVNREGFGTVYLGDYGADSIINHRPLNRAKVLTVAAVPSIIENGKQIAYSGNWKGRGYESYVFAGPVKVGKSTLYVAAVVDVRNTNEFYLNECVDSDGNYVRIVAGPSSTKTGVTVQDGLTRKPKEPANDSIADSAEESKTKYQSWDSDGRELTEGQQSFFADSKIRDADGRLKVMYRGGNEDFTVFDRSKSKPSNLYGRGFYFTDSRSHAGTYGNAREYYLNITSPLQAGSRTMTGPQVRKFLEAVAENEDYGLDNYGRNATPDSVARSLRGKDDYGIINDVNATCIGDMVAAVELFNEVNGTGFDGIVVPTETVAFYPEQIKRTDNEAPTASEDVRYQAWADYSAMTIDELEDEIQNVNEQLAGDVGGTESRRLNNLLTQLNYLHDRRNEELSARAVRTSLNDILNNLDNYTNRDLVTIGNELTSSAWDGLEELSDDEIREGIREIIEERAQEMAPEDMNDPRYGAYVIPPSRGNIVSLRSRRQVWNGELTYDSLRDMQTELNSTIDSISKIEKSGEYNRLIKAALNDTDGEALQAFLDYSESSGLNKLTERRKELEEGISSGTAQLDSQQDEKTLADYSRAVEASGLSEEDYRRKEAHDEFGYTTSFKEAGYMLPDGKLLDFSGKREGGPRGYRSMDHRSISRIYPQLNSDDGMGTDKLIRFVSEGNIRLMPELPGIEISAEKPLTNEQYSGIRRMIQTLADDYMSVDIMAEKGNIAGHLEYEGTVRPDRVINDLKHYYETGEVREQGLSAYYQKWSEDQFSLFDEETGRLHPELQRRIDEAEKLKGDLKRFFSGGDYSEYGITDEMIEDSLDINLYAAAGESDADVDDVFMVLNEISKDIGRDEREKVYELMRGLTRHMKASQAARWQGYGNRNDKAPNEGFADWNRAKDGFVNFGRTRAVSSSMLSDEERSYMEREFNAILNDESASAELKEDARRNLKRLNNRNAVWYQKWEDGQKLFDMVDELADVKSAEYQKWSEDTGDTAKEAANRDRAFATMKAENESLRDIVNSLRAELKESTKQQNKTEAKLERAERQTRRTEAPEVRLDDAKKIARSLIKRFESGTDANDIAARIKELGDYIVSVTGETVDYDTVKSMARDIAYEVLSDVNVPLERENLDLDDRQAIASAIKGRRFTVMQQDKGELDVEGGYNDFRKKNFGKFTLVNEGGESIDSAYTELQSTYGTVYFPEVNSPGEMIMIMADLVDNAEPVMGNPYEDYMAEATEQAANDIIYDAIGETLRQMPETLADKLAKAKAVSRAELRAARNAAKEDRSAAVAKERAAARARYEALQERSVKRIAEIKAEGKARVREVRAHEKAEKWKKVKSIHDYYLEKEERAREARNEAASVTQYKERIIRKATNLMDRVTANTGKKHVPEALRAPLAEFLSTIRFDSKRSLAGGPETQNDLAMAERMSDLADVLAQQKNYQDGAQDAADIMGAYLDLPDGIIEQMRDIARNARDYIRRAGGDYTINTMNSLELRALDQTLDVITAAVNGLNRFHENNVYNHVDEAGASTIRELGELPEISARLRKAGERGSLNPDNFLSWDNTVPIYAFKRYGEAGSSMFDELYRGWSKMAVNAKKVIEFAKSAYSEEEAKTWDKEKKTLTYIDAAGEPVSVEMSVSELMTLYELLKRSQARQHIFGGGIQVPSSSSEHYAVDGRIIAELEQVLTQRQKDVADTLQRYMQDEGGRLGNEVTQARWGISSFGEEHYFPIETESTDRNASGQEASPMRSQDLYRLMNMGFTKSLNKYANNAAVIRPIFDVFSNHMADMVKYNALTMPMLDVMKWYNYRERTDVEGSGTAFLTDSVQRSIERAYGKGANVYFINFMKDLNGVKEGGRGEAGLKAFMSNYKVAQIGFNLRVVMQQPTSIARAALDINPKYLLEGAVTKGDREEMLKHSGIAVWKIALGFYDVNINSSMRQQIKHTETFKEKWQNRSTELAGKADEITWAAMWRACKAEQRDLGYTGEELLERTAYRFDHLMLSTQVMDSTISRSQLMRNPSAAVSEYTGFMSEPTLSYNTLLDAYMDFRGEMRKNGFDAAMKSKGGRMIKAVLVWQISEALVSAVAAIADAARDDDEYETFLQKWLEHFADNYKDNANPLNLLPGISDLVEFVRNKQTGSGYRDVSMVTAGIDKLATFVTDAVKKISGKYKGYKTDWGIHYEGMQAVGMIGGIPIAPIAREFTALHNGFVTIYNDTLGIEYDDRLDYWKTYDEGEKAAIKSAVENGYIDDEAAANALVEADAYDSTEKASQAVYEWSVKAEGYDSKYGKLLEAVKAGDSAAAEAAREKLIDYDYTDDQISDTVKKKVEEWYTDPATQFDRQQAIDALTRYAGMNRTDADNKLSYWFFKSENPDCGNTQKSMGPALRASESRGIITRAEARKIWQGVKAGTQGEWTKTYDEWLSEN